MRVTVSIFFGAAGRAIALSSLDLICVRSAWGGGNDISEKCGESYPTLDFLTSLKMADSRCSTPIVGVLTYHRQPSIISASCCHFLRETQGCKSELVSSAEICRPPCRWREADYVHRTVRVLISLAPER